MSIAESMGVQTTLDRLVIDETGKATGVASRGINCALPAVFCSTRAKQLAEQDNVTLLAWWRDMGPTSQQVQDRQSGPVDPLTFAWKNSKQAGAWLIGEAEKLEKQWLGTQTRAQLEARARKDFVTCLSQMGEWRKQLDRVKFSGALDKDALLRTQWSQNSALWYGTMGALAQGLYPTDSMSGKPVFGRGFESVFGADMPITACYEASEGDGIAYSREAMRGAKRAQALGVEFGAGPAAALAAIPVAGWIAISVIAIAISAIVISGIAAKSINLWTTKCAELTRDGYPCPESPGAQVERASKGMAEVVKAGGNATMWIALLGGGAAAAYFLWPVLSAKRALRK